MGTVMQHLADDQHVVAVPLSVATGAFEHRQRAGQHRATMVSRVPAPVLKALAVRRGKPSRQLQVHLGEDIDRKCSVLRSGGQRHASGKTPER